jgi:hypothetical protein
MESLTSTRIRAGVERPQETEWQRLATTLFCNCEPIGTIERHKDRDHSSELPMERRMNVSRDERMACPDPGKGLT